MASSNAQQMVTTRLDRQLKDEFVRIAEINKQSTSDVLRGLIQRYVDEAHERELERQIANIRANTAEEDEAMQWIAAYGVSGSE